ncbi:MULTISPECIES: ATP synthase F1 subunit epsilon [Psychrilyobacter]|uniref:ATP synthase epsilon chain n=1 Tax=Psychrilyobacter piezotolerans TaxID=2293438 RepID=A0ABX9KE73_9FUSO|nr:MULTISPECIES: ATP synthase F1 subunit epsilon [Psychrilyobacter]MCS5422175.1 ATP synthase F1 subunit epsilon [Psychrilyobacter sp. S5]NDI77678.1 ATP synthase F1 subunit epsilon [Psychrilyobacter piezotolerans]RDE59068.1 ATP synthase F1 subunit epsilon [Psychrilyobacter sp. S5]REI39640.1 ATP synthase F1 subunit epsilon [Psychrilyobacter piezotolerans]
MATFKLEVITPLKKVLEMEVERVILRTSEGDMGILAKHAPLVAELAVGEMKINSEGTEEKFFVAGGFLEISKDRTLVLADEAINIKDIDVEVARKEAELAKQKLAKLKEDRDIAVTQKALQSALTKIGMVENR